MGLHPLSHNMLHRPSHTAHLQGEPSVFEREAASLKGKAGNQKNKAQVAGRDYEWDDFCQVQPCPGGNSCA